MRVQPGIYAAVVIMLHSSIASAQRVLYSPFVGDPSAVRFEVVAKAGNFYWVQKGKKKNSAGLPSNYGIRDKEQSFEIYDSRMEPVRAIPFSLISVTSLKEYFVSDERYFDRLILVTDYRKTNLFLQRYSPEGQLLYEDKLPYQFPFNESANNFLVVRSEDRTKILVLGFETTDHDAQRIHALLLNRDWKLLQYKTYEHSYFSQPFIQYNFINYPVESFSTSAIKLGNEGDWLMTAPSRTNHNFLLFHFSGSDSEFVYREIKLPGGANVDAVALSLNEESHEALAGIMCKFRYSAVKTVSVARYSLLNHDLVFDSTYRFRTVSGARTRNENLEEEDFTALPGGGFMLLKEYGRPYSGTYRTEDFGFDYVGEGEATLIVNQPMDIPGMATTFGNDEYTRYNSLSGSGASHRRGDLNMFFFPGGKNGNCWTGIINKEQVTELNSSFLSYFMIPIRSRLFLLYNSRFRRTDQFGTTTILDQDGQPIDDAGIAFWDINNTLIFQKARQIAINEVAIPYERNQREGFAVIRF